MERWSLSGETASIIMSARKGFLDIFDFCTNSPDLVCDKSVFCADANWKDTIIVQFQQKQLVKK